MNASRHGFTVLLGLAFALTVSAGPLPPPAVVEPAHTGGPYVTIAAGALWLQDADWEGANVEFDTGFSIMGAVGYHWDYGLEIELESGYMQTDSADVTFHGLHGSLDGKFEQVPIMVNALYLIPVADNLSFYVGAGTGIVWSHTEVDKVANHPAWGDLGDDWNFAAQAKAGLSLQVCREASLNIGYRFFWGNDAVGGVDDSIGHVLEGGFTWRF